MHSICTRAYERKEVFRDLPLRTINVSYFCFLPSYWVVAMERIGRKVGCFAWGLQPKRGQWIKGIEKAPDYYLKGKKLSDPSVVY